jgi:hypothetical protein
MLAPARQVQRVSAPAGAAIAYAAVDARPARIARAVSAVEYVDLPAGHWPQFTRPSDLGQAILASISSRTA